MLHTCISLYETKFHHVPHKRNPVKFKHSFSVWNKKFPCNRKEDPVKEKTEFSIGHRIFLYFWTYLWRIHSFWIHYININFICNFSGIFGFVYHFKMDSCDFNCFHKWGNTISIVCNRENLYCAWNIDILFKISAKKAGSFFTVYFVSFIYILSYLNNMQLSYLNKTIKGNFKAVHVVHTLKYNTRKKACCPINYIYKENQF